MLPLLVSIKFLFISIYFRFICVIELLAIYTDGTLKYIITLHCQILVRTINTTLTCILQHTLIYMRKVLGYRYSR